MFFFPSIKYKRPLHSVHTEYHIILSFILFICFFFVFYFVQIFELPNGNAYSGIVTNERQRRYLKKNCQSNLEGDRLEYHYLWLKCPYLLISSIKYVRCCCLCIFLFKKALSSFPYWNILSCVHEIHHPRTLTTHYSPLCPALWY